MKKQLRNHLASAFLLLPVAATFAALPTAAMAQTQTVEVRSVRVLSDRGLEPGSRLTFRVVGTPGGRATVRIGDLRGRIELAETARGVYVGRYVVRRGDQLENDSEIRAVIRNGNRMSSANFTLAEVLNGAPPVAVVPPPPPPPALPALRIERFGIAPFDRLDPGTELQFALDGVPGAAVMVDLPGVANDVGLRETRPGHYEGSYTIRRSDNLNPSRPIVATLRVGERVVTANLALTPAPQVRDNIPPTLLNVTPRDGDVVQGPMIQIAAGFEDRGRSGVDLPTLRIVLSGRDITPEAKITNTGFVVGANLPVGRHTVEVTARDHAGNAMRRAWSFDVRR
jgi:hypothetical protein